MMIDIEDIALESTWINQYESEAIVMDKVGDCIYFSFRGDCEGLEIGIFLEEFKPKGVKHD